MKTTIRTLALLLLGAPAFAQNIKIGPELGGIYTTMSQKIDGESRETNFQFGARAGVAADFQICDNFSIQSGLFLSFNNGTESNYMKSYRLGSGQPASERDERNYSITYLQMPIYAVYKTGVEFDDPHFFFGIGPSINYAVGGRYKEVSTHTLNGQSLPNRYDYALPLGYDAHTDKLRPFDIGANATVGYEAPSGWFVRAHYSLGLLNIAPGGNADNVSRTMGGGLSVGFLFKAVNKPRWE